MRTFAEADAYEVEHRRRREAFLTAPCTGSWSLMQLVPASRTATCRLWNHSSSVFQAVWGRGREPTRAVSVLGANEVVKATYYCEKCIDKRSSQTMLMSNTHFSIAGLEEQGVAGKAGADRAIRYLNRAGLDEGSGTTQARCACCGLLLSPRCNLARHLQYSAAFSHMVCAAPGLDRCTA